jgi:hypothetical protein
MFTMYMHGRAKIADMQIPQTSTLDIMFDVLPLEIVQFILSGLDFQSLHRLSQPARGYIALWSRSASMRHSRTTCKSYRDVSASRILSNGTPPTCSTWPFSRQSVPNAACGPNSFTFQHVNGTVMIALTTPQSIASYPQICLSRFRTLSRVCRMTVHFGCAFFPEAMRTTA